ncbi:MAG TPA: putative metal-binding motif-containing protein [Candidatus Polarisedimenticolia bacterium]|nr:putative metal-binding motif-containing protein [Candidatus Polarisedimenticolia bacterium]
MKRAPIIGLMLLASVSSAMQSSGERGEAGPTVAAGRLDSRQALAIRLAGPLDVTIDPVAVSPEQVVGRNPIRLRGHAHGLSVVRIEWLTSHGDKGTATGIEPWIAEGIPLRPGPNRVTVTAIDNLGRTGSAELTVTYQPSPEELFVDCSAPSGGAGSRDSPLNELQAAADRAQTGGVVTILGGACPQYVEVLHGFTLRGDPDAPHARIEIAGDCGPSTYQECVIVDTDEPVVFRRLSTKIRLGNRYYFTPYLKARLEDMVGSGIGVGGDNHLGDLAAPRVSLRDSRDTALGAFRTGFIEVVNSRNIALGGSGTASGLDFHVIDSTLSDFVKSSDGCMSLRLERSRVHGRVLFNGDPVPEGQCITFTATESEFTSARITGATGYRGSADFRFSDSRFEDSSILMSAQVDSIFGVTGPSALVLVNNLIRNTPISIELGGAISDPMPMRFESLIVHNTLVQSDIGLKLRGLIDPMTPWSLRAVNNIISGGEVGFHVDALGQLETEIAGNNVHGQSVARYGGDLADPTDRDGNISADPLFVDASGGEYRLSPGSPCIDAGRGGPEVPAVDHDGVTRPQDGDGDGVALPDIGAFEFALADRDGDGHSELSDCDDGDPAVHPGAVDLPGDMVDQDCDGVLSCDPAGAWLAHGRFVGCVSRDCARLVAGGLIGASECARIVSEAARGGVGTRRP